MVATIVLVAAAPLVVMWHALPQTDGVARWWWRSLAGLLSIQIIQALVLAVAVEILLPGPPEGGQEDAALQVLGFANSGWVTLLVLGALLWVLVKVPGWVWSMIRIGGGGRTLLGSAVRAAIVWKTGGLLRGALTAGKATRSGSGTTGAAGSEASRRRGSDNEDPYANPPVFAGG